MRSGNLKVDETEGVSKVKAEVETQRDQVNQTHQATPRGFAADGSERGGYVCRNGERAAS